MTWDTYFFRMAMLVSQKSKDPSTKVGCVIIGPDREVRATGFNGLPRGVADKPERYADRDFKYPMIVHAETNAVFHAARIGVSLKDCVAYTLRPPCSRCAGALIQAGVVHVMTLEPPLEWTTSPEWGQDMTIAQLMLEEAKVQLSYFRYDAVNNEFICVA